LEGSSLVRTSLFWAGGSYGGSAAATARLAAIVRRIDWSSPREEVSCCGSMRSSTHARLCGESPSSEGSSCSCSEPLMSSYKKKKPREPPRVSAPPSSASWTMLATSAPVPSAARE